MVIARVFGCKFFARKFSQTTQILHKFAWIFCAQIGLLSFAQAICFARKSSFATPIFLRFLLASTQIAFENIPTKFLVSRYVCLTLIACDFCAQIGFHSFAQGTYFARKLLFPLISIISSLNFLTLFLLASQTYVALGGGGFMALSIIIK